MAIAFTKGHGTQNDFILIDDPEGDLKLDAGTVAQLSDRRQGLGADGVIRVIRTAALLRDLDAGVPSSVTGAADRPEWFMDYRNADGSISQMCGNGVRVFAAHLLARGWIGLPVHGEFSIGTRAGVKTVRRGPTGAGAGADWFGVDLGPWHLPGGAAALTAGSDTTVSVPSMLPNAPEPVLLTGLPALSVNLGNPHAVVALPSQELLESLDLTRPPGVDPLPGEGVNVEFIVPNHDSSAGTGHLSMRVHERGVGETRSCGTGAVAAVLAARAWAGPDAPSHWTVDVPGGRLEIDVAATSLVAGEQAILAGPAVLVADGELLSW